MHSRHHRCPQCSTVGKVNRSKPRNSLERLRLRGMPIYGVYRCHNCNWRGWLLRSNATRFRVVLVFAVYVIVALSIVTVAVVTIQRIWPSPTYEYQQ